MARVRLTTPAPNRARREAPADLTARRTGRKAVLQLHKKIGNRAVSRLFDGDQQETIGLAGGVVGESLRRRIDRARGHGRPLHPVASKRFGEAFGAGFGAVRVHTGPEPDHLSRSMSARAFTVGNDIFFGRGGYRPGSAAGDHLLAHELAHVVQQGGGVGRLQTKLTVGPPDDASEREADRVADAVLRNVGPIDTNAESPNRSMQFTVGRDLFLGTDQHQPATPLGQRFRAHELTSATQQGADGIYRGALSEPIIRRKIGFEFEDNHWESYEHVPGLSKEEENKGKGKPEPDTEWKVNPAYVPKGGHNIWARAGGHINETVKQYDARAFTKKEKLHHGTGFDLESDGPYKQGRMDIEFVTQPFEEGQSGYKQLKTALSGIEKVMDMLEAMSPMPRSAEAGAFYTPWEHGLSNDDVLLAGGSKRANFKMQVTHGVRLEDIPALFETFGSRQEDEGKETEKARGPARALVGSKLELQQKIMAEAPGQARLMVNGLMNAELIKEGPGVPALTGFLTYALSYVQWVQVLSWDGLKIALPFMSRYDFGKLFGMLPPEQQAALQSPRGREVLIHLFSVVLQKWGVRNGKRTAPLTGESPLMKFESEGLKFPAQKLRFYKLLEKLTTADWVNGILNGHDYLTASGMMAYLKQEGFGEQALEFEKSVSIFSRGHAATKTLVGAEDDLAIMENRMIDPRGRELDMDEAASVSLAYHAFMSQMKAKGGQQKFPKSKVSG